MAQSTNLPGGQTVYIPNSYAGYAVLNSNSGLSANGILMVVGESAMGPDFTLETDLSQNAFGPDQQADVIAKYGSGNLVDAFRSAIVAVNDPTIGSSFNRVILVKTNPSAKAQVNLLASNLSSTYGVLADQSYGKQGNLIYYTVNSNTAEAKPTTGAFTFLPPIASLNAAVRVNGGASEAITISGAELPPAVVSAFAGLTGVSATGGANRGCITAVSGTLAVVATGNNVVITISTPFAALPTAGDTLYVPSGSAIEGSGNANCGSYVVNASGANTISATKLMDATGSPGALTAPVNVSATNIAAITDAECFAPIVVTLSGSSVIDGAGKSLEINELTSGTDLLSNCCYALSTTKVAWVSKSVAPQLLVSASEQSILMNINRQSDGTSESFTAGGRIALTLGYVGTTGTATITGTAFTTTVAGGTGAALSINLANYNTLNDLAVFINAQTGYSCVVGNAALGQFPPSALDDGTFGICSTFGNKTGRAKVDAYDFFTDLTADSTVVQLGVPAAQAASGLPGIVTTPTFLAGGTLGGTSDAIFQNALVALEAVVGNFLIPCISQDATADILLGLTDSSSSYTIAATNAACKTHVLAMSTQKARRRRQAFCSIRSVFTVDEAAAYGMASARVSMSFQDMKDLGLNGIQQWQPWYSAVKAAGAQAAAGYKALVNKQINCSGVLQAAGDFKDSNTSMVENALIAGLLVMQRDQNNGGYIWVSDQTTYSVDNNFVYNSIQAVYAADTIASTLEIRMGNAFVGQSIADVSAAQALSAIQAIMGDLFKQKLVAASSDAALGYKNAVVKVNGPVMAVTLEVKLAGAIYFVPINFLVSQVTQTASQ